MLKTPLIITALSTALLCSQSFASKEVRFQRPDPIHKPAKTSTPAAPLSDWWNGPYATGNWGGARQSLADHGVAINGSVTFAFLGNPTGGESRGVAQNFSAGLSLAVDFGKLFKIKALEDTDFFTDFVQRGGNNLSAEHTKNQFTASQSYGGQNFRVNEFYLKQSFLDKKAWIKFGRLDAGNDFLNSPLFCTFVNNSFCGNPVGVFFNVPYSAYPNAQWGALVGGKPTDYLVAKFGVYNTNQDVALNHYHGTNLSFDNNQGVQLIGSLTYLLNQGQYDTGYTGSYTAGMMYYTAKNTSAGSTDAGYFLNLEQMLYRDGPSGSTRWLKAFTNIEIFNHWDTSYMPLFVNAGLVYQGLLTSRPLDQLALGVSYGRFGTDNINNNGASFGAETLIELTYKIQVNPWFFVQPDLQLMIHPFGGSATLAKTTTPPASAWVVGFETGVTF